MQQSCLDVSYADAIAQLRDTSAASAGVGIRQWVYQTCTEFGYFQTSDSGTDRPAASVSFLSSNSLAPTQMVSPSATACRSSSPSTSAGTIIILYIIYYLLIYLLH